MLSHPIAEGKTGFLRDPLGLTFGIMVPPKE